MVDVQTQIAAVGRSQRDAVIDGHECRVQTIRQEYASGVADVWDAATSAERISRWFLPVTGELRLGGRYQLEGNAGGEVLACDPPTDGDGNGGAASGSYRITWEYGGGVTWLDVRVSAAGDDHAVLELEHTARVADVPAEMWNTFGPGATGVGWDQGLLGLALYLSLKDGETPPFSPEEWMLSPEGMRFARAAADAWAVAHVASGASELEAKQAADATYGFYTGTTPGQ